MKKISFRWRVTLFTVILITVACIVLNYALTFFNNIYMDELSRFFNQQGQPPKVVLPVDDVSGDTLEIQISQEVQNNKMAFGIQAWLSTGLISVLSGILAYFLMGHSLRPIRDFSEQAEAIELKNLSNARLSENAQPEFQQLSHSVNQMLDRLDSGFSAQNEFVGNAAHELRTPLALIQAKLELCDPKSGTREGDTLLLVKEQTERLTHLIASLMELSEAESLPLKDRIQLSPLIEEVLEDLAPLAEKRKIRLSQSGENLELLGNDLLLYRLFFNLVENAIKYNREGGSVELSLQCQQKMAQIRIRDEGLGIPKEYQESIFQPFFRVDKSRSRELGGVGLGLALVNKICKLHGGSITVESSSPEGTVLLLQIPLPLANRTM